MEKCTAKAPLSGLQKTSTQVSGRATTCKARACSLGAMAASLEATTIRTKKKASASLSGLTAESTLDFGQKAYRTAGVSLSPQTDLATRASG
jgi:hypothetical protein